MHNNKKAALELSVGTLVIIIIAITMLALGIFLVAQIFQGATESVDILDDKVQNEIKQLFTDEDQDVVVKLGSDKTIKVKPGSDSVLVGIGARTPDGSSIEDTGRLKYELELDTVSTQNNCLKKIGATRTKGIFITSLDTQIRFDEIDGANAFAGVQLKVPDATATCSQKVFVKVTDTDDNSFVGQRFFVIEVLKESIF